MTDDPLNDTSCDDIASQSQKLASMDDEDFEVLASAATIVWLPDLRAVDRLGRPITEWISIAPGRVLYGARAIRKLRGCRYPIGDPKSAEFRSVMRHAVPARIARSTRRCVLGNSQDGGIDHANLIFWTANVPRPAAAWGSFGQ